MAACGQLGNVALKRTLMLKRRMERMMHSNGNQLLLLSMSTSTPQLSLKNLKGFMDIHGCKNECETAQNFTCVTLH